MSPRSPRRWSAVTAVFATVALLAAGACQRDRLYGERKPIGKAYHAFTSKYNAYFNANELVEEAEEALAESAPADYGEILPVYPAYAVASAQSASSKLDEAMEKVSLTVNIHRPNAFEDDAYLLLGRAQLLKQDYESAQHTLEYSVKDFDPDNEAARLRRIEKERIADEKKRAKAAGERAGPSRRTSSRTPRRRTTPQRRKSSRTRTKSSTRRKSSREGEARKKSSRGGSAKERARAREEAAAARKAAAKERKEAEEAAEKEAEDKTEEQVKKRRRANDDRRASRKKAPAKKKSRAEMAREQREARMAEEKAALKEEQRREREAEQAGQAEALANERAEREAREREEAAAAADAEATARETDARAEAEGGGLDAALVDGAGLAAADDEERPKHGIFVHEKATQDFDYWLARTYIARERYLDAERLLGRLSRSGATWKRLRRQLPATYADMYLRRDMLAEAVPYLEDAVALTKKKRERARYAFILGQVQQRLGDAPGAIASFEEVVKLKPAFDMAFNAQLALLTTEYRVGEASSASTLKQLTRMSKEDKYDLFRDQIFYEMADIALRDGDREAGMAYMRQSLDNNAGNARQAAKGYRRLADLFLEDEDYVLASAYYDSTAQVLPTEDPSYPEVVAYRDNLSPVAASLSAIALQDSLLRVAAMSPEDQRALALEIDEERRAKALADAIAAVRQANAPQQRGSNPQDAVRGGLQRGRPQGGPVIQDFFAYDSKSVRRGQKEFDRRWGDRQLVDNWRTLSARESNAALDDLDALRPGAVAEEDVDVEGILADVPNTPEAKQAANDVIEAALIALGRDYRDKLDNPERAADALAELLRRFPETEDAAEALYLLALAQDDLGQRSGADATRARLQREHPDSKFARSLAEPDFFDEAKGAEKALVDYYDETYRLFKADQAGEARTRLTAAPETFGAEHALSPRFALLTAQVAGRIDGRDAYVAALKEVVAKYPDAEETVKAKDILRLLGERSSTASALDKAADTDVSGAEAPAFDDDRAQAHYFLAVLPKGANMSESRAKVADFNGEHHRLEKLAVSNVSMVRDGKPTPVIVIRRFKTAEEGMSYLESVRAKQDEFLDGVAFESALISQANYREVLRKKTFAEYLDFFAANY